MAIVARLRFGLGQALTAIAFIATVLAAVRVVSATSLHATRCCMAFGALLLLVCAAEGWSRGCIMSCCIVGGIVGLIAVLVCYLIPDSDTRMALIYFYVVLAGLVGSAAYSAKMGKCKMVGTCALLVAVGYLLVELHVLTLVH